jgi:hypothetical protein
MDTEWTWQEGRLPEEETKVGQETTRVLHQINTAKRYGFKRTEITIAASRRKAVEWRLEQWGFKTKPGTDPDMTVIRWK